MRLKYRRRMKWWRKRRKRENKCNVNGSKKKMKKDNTAAEKWKRNRYKNSENEKMQRKMEN
jgi:hypothetical protein